MKKRSHNPPQKLENSVAQRELLLRDIPHRICAALTWLENMKGNWKMPPDPKWEDLDRDKFHIWCVGRSVDEGRKAAMRWLTEFVGVASESGQPVIPNYKPKDVWIEHINHGKLFDLTNPNAQKLADIWLGCSQSSMHSTRNTSHPPVGEKELGEVLKIVIEHLEKNLYSPNNFILLDVIHDQEDRKQFKLPRRFGQTTNPGKAAGRRCQSQRD